MWRCYEEPIVGRTRGKKLGKWHWVEWLAIAPTSQLIRVAMELVYH